MICFFIQDTYSRNDRAVVTWQCFILNVSTNFSVLPRPGTRCWCERSSRSFSAVALVTGKGYNGVTKVLSGFSEANSSLNVEDENAKVVETTDPGGQPNRNYFAGGPCFKIPHRRDKSSFGILTECSPPISPAKVPLTMRYLGSTAPPAPP